MTSHTVLRSRPSRTLSIGLASALTLGALGFAIPTANAADPVAGPALHWKVSTQFANNLSAHTFDGGASEDGDKVITFPGGVGSYNPNGAASISYSGSVTAAFNNPSSGAELYRVTIAEPRIVIDSDGEGVLSAIVSSNVTGSDSTDPKRVVVTTFDAASGDWSEGDERRTLTATPDWVGVLPAGSQQALDLGLASDRPVNGASFAPSFLGQLAPAVRAHFYLTGTQPNKTPATITAEADPISVAATATVTGSNVNVAVQGTGFSGESLQGDSGVYVGVALSGGLPDVSSPAGMASFAGAQWVPAGSITDGLLSTTVTIPVDKLDANQSYSVYTWQAHTHSTASQDTETALTIDRAPEPSTDPTPEPSTDPTPDPQPTSPVIVATSTTLKVDTTTYGSAQLTAAVSGGTGSVTLTGKGIKSQTKPVVDGKATFTLADNLKIKSTYTLTAAYSGDATHLASTSGAAKLKISKGKVARDFTVSKTPTKKKKGKGTVRVAAPVGAKAATGTAYVKFAKGKSSKTVKVKLSSGKRSVTIPKLKKGTWKVSVKYAGDSRYTSAGYQEVTSVTVTK